MYARALDGQFARDVRSGLTGAGQKTLPCRYLYDDLGSALFDAITLLPEYGLTRADIRVLQSCAAELIRSMPPDIAVVELGSGTGAKTRPILQGLRQHQDVVYYPIDVSSAALEKCEQELRPLGTVVPLEASYLDGLQQAVERRKSGQAMLVLFLGSTIGNFEAGDALDFLAGIRSHLLAGDALLLGTDLVKPAPLMLAAYDDPTGVTAAFNLNLLARINRELGADFDLRRFEHVARYSDGEQRVEMHLRSRARQTVNIPQAGLSVEFERLETIFTEACHKFQPEQICKMAVRSGFRVEQQWIDREWPFAESLLLAV